MASSINARMGFVGFVKLIPDTGVVAPVLVRVTSCDLKLTQEITYPDLVDGKVDQTVYQLGPQQVGGNLAFPLLHEFVSTKIPSATGGCGDTTGGTSLARTLWEFAAQRDAQGRMLNRFDAAVRYADNLAYVYKGCYVNQMTFTINQSEPVNVSAELIGGAAATSISSTLRETLTHTATGISGTFDNSTAKMLTPARVITWNDAVVKGWTDSSADATILTEQVREFTCTINNNIERFYSLNGELKPVDIAAKKREISGTLKLMGANYDLSTNAEDNENRNTSESLLAFGYKLGNSTASMYWATGLYGVIFEIEEISLSTGLFETSTKWRALGDCSNSHLATRLGGTTVPTDLPRPDDSTQYGAVPNVPIVFTAFS